MYVLSSYRTFFFLSCAQHISRRQQLTNKHNDKRYIYSTRERKRDRHRANNTRTLSISSPCMQSITNRTTKQYCSTTAAAAAVAAASTTALATTAIPKEIDPNVYIYIYMRYWPYVSHTVLYFISSFCLFLQKHFRPSRALAQYVVCVIVTHNLLQTNCKHTGTQ